MASQFNNPAAEVAVSVGIFAWNEQRALPAMLETLFAQSLFARLRERGEKCEILCVANGCTDDTVAVAEQTFVSQTRLHPDSAAFTARAINLPQRGKVNAWNQFVHRLSARCARVLFMMDADILIRTPDTLWNMLLTLAERREATVATDLPRKHLALRPARSLRERLSLGASKLTHAAPGQLCGQLYAIRAASARNIFLPRDLTACEDGFLKAVVCANFLTEECRPERIQLAPNAEHTFEAYTSVAALIKNQKRQAMGQTIVHLLVDHILPQWPIHDRRHLAEAIRAVEIADPDWLKRHIAEHLARIRFFWRLYPELLGQRFTGWKGLPFGQRCRALPSVLAGAGATLLGSFLAFRTLKSGCTDYWPRAERLGSELPTRPGSQTRSLVSAVKLGHSPE
jgi:glycosyltransferase involved in cell wall biosynthesis